MAELEVVDLAPYYDGDDADRRAVAASIDRACRELGFLAVTGHRVPADLVGETRQAVRGFFDQPLEAKLAARTVNRASGRGYVPVEGETLSYTTTFAAPPDLKESFSIGPFDTPSDPYHRFEPSGIAFSPNVWPPEPSTFAPALRRYYRALDELASDLLTLTALAFDLTPDWFVAKNDRPTSALRVLHYPPGPGAQAEPFVPGAGTQAESFVPGPGAQAESFVPGPGAQYPASPHTDYGTWTILHKRSGLTGLEAQALDGSWVQVRAPENGFVINVGDLLMRWTGGQWLSTLHRVVPVASSDPAGELSLVFFHQPNWDVVVYPWTTDVVRRPEVAQRYAADAAEQHYYGVTVGEFVFGKYQATVSDEALAGGASA
jgi:isopenicillin N synthase-like dioxygenase